MIALISGVIELIILIVKAWFSASADRKLYQEALKQAQAKFSELAKLLEDRMREQNRADQGNADRLQDEMDKDSNQEEKSAKFKSKASH